MTSCARRLVCGRHFLAVLPRSALVASQQRGSSLSRAPCSTRTVCTSQWCCGTSCRTPFPSRARLTDLRCFCPALSTPSAFGTHFTRCRIWWANLLVEATYGAGHANCLRESGSVKCRQTVLHHVQGGKMDAHAYSIVWAYESKAGAASAVCIKYLFRIFQNSAISYQPFKQDLSKSYTCKKFKGLSCMWNCVKWKDLKALHASLTAAICGLHLPAAHLTQTLAFVAPATSLHVPPGQLSHFRRELSPVRLLKRPLGHSMQAFRDNAPSCAHHNVPRSSDMQYVSMKKRREGGRERERERILE